MLHHTRVDFNRIDILDLGIVWQGGDPDATIDDQATFPGPLLVVDMDRGITNEQWINHTNVEAVLAVWIDDSPDACLKDTVLLGLAEAIIGWLAKGGNVYVHCAAGISRASYMDVAVHCLVLGLGADQALDRIRSQRPVANPNSGFMTQLRRLFPPQPGA